MYTNMPDLRLIYYQLRYGKCNIYDLEPDGDGGFFIAVHHSNIGRIQEDINNEIAFIYKDKLIYINRPR